MRLDQLTGYTAFLAVSRHQGFTAAAAEMQVSTSALSQAVMQLEQRLGARLFNRTTRSVRLTEAGAVFLARVGPAFDELTSAESELVNQALHPSGMLRLTVPRIASMLLESLIPTFLAAHPDINIEVVVEDALVDIVAGGYDAGIRLGESIERDMVATRIGPEQETALVASPNYLRSRGTPKSIAELALHSCINHRLASGEIYRWELKRNKKQIRVEVSGQLTVNDPSFAVASAISGVGIALTLKGFIKEELACGRLIQILADHSPAFPGFFIYYSTRRLLPAKLRAFIDFAREKRPAHG